MPDTGLTDAFAPPWVEEIHRGDETLIFTLPHTDMDDWAACAQVLKANRRKENEAKLALNTRLTPVDREWLLMRAGRGAPDHVSVRLLLPDGNPGRHQERAEEGDHEARRDHAPQRHGG
jgi:hypothetical protein